MAEFNVEAFNQSVAALGGLATSFNLSTALSRVPRYDGRTISLKDFSADVKAAATYVNEDQTQQFLTGVLTKLYGTARDSVNGKNFTTIEALLKYLKDRFTQGKNYSFYAMKINKIQMKKGDTIGDFYDKLVMLLTSAKTALKETMAQPNDANLQTMMRPLQITAADVFLRGLPPDIARMVDAQNPADLAAAYEKASKIECKMKCNILPDGRFNKQEIDHNTLRDVGDMPLYIGNVNINRGYNNYRGGYEPNFPKRERGGFKNNFNQPWHNTGQY